MILDLYAGAGGWDEGARLLNLGPTAGLEIDDAASRTAVAAGHPRVRCDIATYPTTPFTGRVTGLAGSPPCQGWSSAGKRAGELDRARVHELVDRYAAGHDTPGGGWVDDRSHHVAQPVRWIRDLRPEWVCLEQVPPVLPLWEHVGRVLRSWGYATWAGLLCAADYGVPQTRVRAFLIASRIRSVRPPTPTHFDPRRGTAFWGRPWVSMAEALGWDGINRPARTICGDRTPRWAYGQEASYGTGWTLRDAVPMAYRNGNQSHACIRAVDQPAPTVHFGERVNEVTWVLESPHREKVNDRTRPRSLDEPAHTIAFGHADMRWTATRPATTVAADPRIPPPGHRDRAGGERQHAESIRVTVAEAAVLQGFRPDYPWHGTKTSQYGQVGNCVPPPLAAAVLATATGREEVINVP